MAAADFLRLFPPALCLPPTLRVIVSHAVRSEAEAARRAFEGSLMHEGADAAMGPHVQRAAEDLHPAIVLALFQV